MPNTRSDRYFPRVREAREALANKALEILELHMKVVKEALAAQDFETANDALQFLALHIPKDPDGEGLLDQSIDTKAIEAKGGGGPQIQIGIALGGVNKPKELAPAEIIEVDPLDRD